MPQLLAISTSNLLSVKSPKLGGRFGYFFLFSSALGGGKGSPRRQERGRFFIENPRRGRVCRRVVWSELGNGGGGLNSFFGTVFYFFFCFGGGEREEESDAK